LEPSLGTLPEGWKAAVPDGWKASQLQDENIPKQGYKGYTTKICCKTAIKCFF
jgi:hypothetical protein